MFWHYEKLYVHFFFFFFFFLKLDIHFQNLQLVYSQGGWKGRVQNRSLFKIPPLPRSLTSWLKFLPEVPTWFPLFPLLIPVKSCHYRKKNPILPIAPSQYLSVPPFHVGPPFDLAPSSSPPLPLSVSAPFHYFPDDKKIYDNKIPDAGERARAGPKVTPLFSSASIPLFTHPPLIALTQGGCRSPPPSHARYCLKPHHHHRQHHHHHHHHHHPNSSHSEPLLCTHTHTHTHSHTLAKEILIIISEWYDWIRSRGEMKEEPERQRWEMEKGGRECERERTCGDEGI